MKTLILTLWSSLFLFASAVNAQVSVAFFEFYNSQGQLVQLEPDGRFFHVAISYKEGWLHVYPHRGVEHIPNFDQIGEPTLILTHPDLKPLTEAQVAPYLGLPFDFTYCWEDANSSYCSKLIAQTMSAVVDEGKSRGVIAMGTKSFIDLVLKPMSFSSSAWEKAMVTNRGQMGVSPDDEYRALMMLGFQQFSYREFLAQRCDHLLLGGSIPSLRLTPEMSSAPKVQNNLK